MQTEDIFHLEQSLRHALEASKIGLWDWNIATGEVKWSPRQANLFSSENHSKIGDLADFISGVHPEDVGRVEAALRHSVATGADYSEEFRVVRPDGSVRWISGSGSVGRKSVRAAVRMVGTSVDITDRKNREINLAFLSRLQNAYAPLSSEADIMRAASKLIAEHLDLAHCCFVEVDNDGATCRVLQDHHSLGMRDLEGEYRLADFHSNDEARRLLGGEALVVHDVRAGARSVERVDQFAAVGIGAFVSAPYLAQGRCKFVLHASRVAPHVWSSAEVETLSEVAARIYLRIERARAETAFLASAEEVRMLAEVVPQIIWATRSDGFNIYFNQKWTNYTGLSAEETGGENWVKPFHPDDKAKASNAWLEATANFTDYSVECRLRRFDGVYRWWLIRAAPQRDADGVILKWFGTCTDIDDLKRAEAQRNQLLMEVNHRSKNLLAVVQAIAQQSGRNADPATFVLSLSGRIAALAANQDLLVKSNWHGIETGDLVKSQLSDFKELIGNRIFIDGPLARLTVPAAQGIGMALHELSTNAVRYGALSNSTGRIKISWRFDRSREDMFTMSWREEGGPVVSPAPRKRFGLTVIGSMAASSVNGDFKLDFPKTGVVWNLTAAATDVLEKD